MDYQPIGSPDHPRQPAERDAPDARFAPPCLQALFDLEATNNELKAELRDLYITSAKEVDIPGTSRKAIIVHVSRMQQPFDVERT